MEPSICMAPVLVASLQLSCLEVRGAWLAAGCCSFTAAGCSPTRRCRHPTVGVRPCAITCCIGCGSESLGGVSWVRLAASPASSKRIPQSRMENRSMETRAIHPRRPTAGIKRRDFDNATTTWDAFGPELCSVSKHGTPDAQTGAAKAKPPAAMRMQDSPAPSETLRRRSPLRRI